MNKLDKLEKLQELKQSGALSEEEFEKEKKKVLKETKKSKFKGNKKISIIAFIACVLLLATTIAFIVRMSYWYKEYDDISIDYYLAENTYRDYKEDGYEYRYEYLYENAKDEYYDLKSKYDKREKKYHFFKYGAFVTGGLCIISLGIGILFIERKKKDK